MGAACCVAAREKTIQPGSSGEILHRNFRHSPTWSFRWDNRVGIAGEDAAGGWVSDVASGNDTLDAKSATDVSAQVSDAGSSLDGYRMGGWRKSPLNQETTKDSRTSTSPSGLSIARNVSMEAKPSTEAPQLPDPSSVKLSPSTYSTASLSTSPLSSRGHLLPPSPMPSRWVQGSPGHRLAQHTSDSHSSSRNSPSINSIFEEGKIPTRVSNGRSSDGWSAHAFSELMSVSQRERWSFDSEACSFTRDKLSRDSAGNSRSISMDFQTCGICSRLLTERSVWSSQKIMVGNELSVVAVLICGHVYHAECLETITPEINKYDPPCPICTIGEKKTLKFSGKMLKAERDLKAKLSKKSKNRVVDTDSSLDFDNWKINADEGKSPKLSSSSSLKISAAKPFLKRHFSFGSRGNKPVSESPSNRKKGLFWAKSSRV